MAFYCSCTALSPGEKCLPCLSVGDKTLHWPNLSPLPHSPPPKKKKSQKEAPPLKSRTNRFFNRIWAAYLSKETVEVYVNRIPISTVVENVLPVSVTKSQDVTHHGDNRCRTTVWLTARIPEKMIVTELNLNYRPLSQYAPVTINNNFKSRPERLRFIHLLYFSLSGLHLKFFFCHWGI